MVQVLRTVWIRPPTRKTVPRGHARWLQQPSVSTFRGGVHWLRQEGHEAGLHSVAVLEMARECPGGFEGLRGFEICGVIRLPRKAAQRNPPLCRSTEGRCARGFWPLTPQDRASGVPRVSDCVPDVAIAPSCLVSLLHRRPNHLLVGVPPHPLDDLLGLWIGLGINACPLLQDHSFES